MKNQKNTKENVTEETTVVEEITEKEVLSEEAAQLAEEVTEAEEIEAKLAEGVTESADVDAEVELSDEVAKLAEEVAQMTEEAAEEAEPADSEEIETKEVSEKTAEPEETAEEAAKAEESAENATETEEVTESADNAAETALQKKRIKTRTKVMIIIGAVIAVLVAAYFAVASYYSDRFLIKTTVNGTDCAGMTVEEVEAYMQSQVENYVLTITERNGVTEEIKGVDIGIKYNGVDVIQEAFAEQNSYAWITSLYNASNIEANVDFDYDQTKLDEAIGALACLKEENQVAPVSATPVYADGTYTIQEETYGSQMNQEQLYTTIHDTVAAMETSVDLEEANCYVMPTYTKDSSEVVAAKDALNTCLKAKITYSLDSIEVTVDASQISQWISVDAGMNVIVDETQVRAFTDTLGTKYNTPNASEEITTPTGKVATVANARLGRVVGSAAECEQLISEVKAGKTITREPILSQTPTPEGTVAWGTTYIEVDLSEQHMWYIAEGTVAFECDVVTGAPGLDTPAGYFTILEKLSPKVLRGNIMPNGKPEYVTPVKYWARVTWSGIGFHDATWQSAFGGTRYKDGYGSHGCINMSLDDVATFYGMISVGCPVIIHY